MTKLTPDLATKYKYCLVGCLQGPKAITMDAANPSSSASSVSSLSFLKSVWVYNKGTKVVETDPQDIRTSRLFPLLLFRIWEVILLLAHRPHPYLAVSVKLAGTPMLFSTLPLLSLFPKAPTQLRYSSTPDPSLLQRGMVFLNPYIHSPNRSAFFSANDAQTITADRQLFCRTSHL